MKTTNRKPVRAALFALALTQLACAGVQAMPATGRDRGPFAGPHPEYPEINCDLNTTIDCRPPQNGP